jgi:hypothetical protein
MKEFEFLNKEQRNALEKHRPPVTSSSKLE